MGGMVGMVWLEWYGMGWGGTRTLSLLTSSIEGNLPVNLCLKCKRVGVTPVSPIVLLLDVSLTNMANEKK